MAGWVSQGVRDLLSLVNARFYQADDGSRMSGVGALLVDANGNPINIAPNPSQTARLTTSAADTNSLTIKSTPGYLFGIVGYNAAASVRYLRLINKNNGNAAGDPAMMVLRLEPSSQFKFDWPAGYYFSIAICRAFTTDDTSTSSNGVSAGDIKNVNAFYS